MSSFIYYPWAAMRQSSPLSALSASTPSPRSLAARGNRRQQRATRAGRFSHRAARVAVPSHAGRDRRSCCHRPHARCGIPRPPPLADPGAPEATASRRVCRRSRSTCRGGDWEEETRPAGRRLPGSVGGLGAARALPVLSIDSWLGWRSWARPDFGRVWPGPDPKSANSNPFWGKWIVLVLVGAPRREPGPCPKAGVDTGELQRRSRQLHALQPPPITVARKARKLARLTLVAFAATDHPSSRAEKMHSVAQKARQDAVSGRQIWSMSGQLWSTFWSIAGPKIGRVRAKFGRSRGKRLTWTPCWPILDQLSGRFRANLGRCWPTSVNIG